MQHGNSWSAGRGPLAFPRIPSGVSYEGIAQHAEFTCPHCRSQWNTKAGLMEHIEQVHQQRSKQPMPEVTDLMPHNLEDNQSAFLLEGAAEDDDHTDLGPQISANIETQILESGDSTTAADLDLQDIATETASDNEPSPLLSRALATGSTGFPCNKCSAGPFQTQRELDVHTSVVHLTCVAAPMISTPSAATDPSQDLHGTFPAGRQGPHDLPRGFRGRPAGAEAEAAPAPPPPLAELACRFCPPHKQVQALDSKEALFLHVQEAHLRCPAEVLGYPCSVGPFPSVDLLRKHVQAVHIQCPHCMHAPFRSHGALHKHIQTAHECCSHCSKGSFASAKALADHVRAAHTSQHIRGRRTPNPAPAPSGAASELKPDALYYIQDIDGLQYLARLISVIDDHTLHVRWTAQEHTCIVPAHFVVSQVDVIVGSFVVIAMEDEEFYEQGEVIALDNALRQCSVRILHSHNTVILGIDTIVDLITLRPKQMCFLSLDNGIAQGEIVSVDTAERQCTVRWVSPGRRGLIQTDFDCIRQIVELRKGWYCAIKQGDQPIYEAQLLEVMWSQSQCNVCRSDIHQEVVVPLHCIIEAWKGDHVLDDKTILPSDGAPPPRTLFPSQFQTQPHTAVYKPAMRFAAALPEEKPKIKEKKKKKKKNDKKSTDGDGTSSPSPEPTATDSSNTGSPGSPDDVTVPGAPTPPPAPGAPSPYPSPAGEYSTSVGMYPGYEYTGYQAGGYSADAYTAGYYSGYGYPVGMYPSYASPPRIPDSSYVTPPYPAVTISASLSPYTQPPVVVASHYRWQANKG